MSGRVIFDELVDNVEAERSRSEHTRRAYRGDLRSLFAFLGERKPGSGVSDLTLPILRSWLAAGAASGSVSNKWTNDLIHAVLSKVEEKGSSLLSGEGLRAFPSSW